MDHSTGKDESNSKLGSLFEALSLISITLILISLYLYASDSVGASWVVLFVILAGIGIVGSVAASYYQINKTNRIAETTEFRVNRQLVETLIAKDIPHDVIFGLKNMIKDGDLTFEGEAKFVKRLTTAFGKERSGEVNAVILKYAKVAEEEVAPETTKPAAVPELPQTTVQEKLQAQSA